jgi:hypothetical protein
VNQRSGTVYLRPVRPLSVILPATLKRSSEALASVSVIPNSTATSSTVLLAPRVAVKLASIGSSKFDVHSDRFSFLIFRNARNVVMANVSPARVKPIALSPKIKTADRPYSATMVSVSIGSNPALAGNGSQDVASTTLRWQDLQTAAPVRTGSEQWGQAKNSISRFFHFRRSYICPSPKNR